MYYVVSRANVGWAAENHPRKLRRLLKYALPVYHNGNYYLVIDEDDVPWDLGLPKVTKAQIRTRMVTDEDALRNVRRVLLELLTEEDEPR